MFLDGNLEEESKKVSNNKSPASRCCLALACLLVKVLLIKKTCTPLNRDSLTFRVLYFRNKLSMFVILRLSSN